ncbi:uncharacterized protein Dere_GG26324 [Drosophila erecta]|uniref:Uncharacterized protein n=1 Tax=Drosophila erecta TaxID=7220 RepID=A0A0Q5UGR1_DROER|nr:uncharacterized protein Dere_GG26324 [Drosophila erecta]
MFTAVLATLSQEFGLVVAFILSPHNSSRIIWFLNEDLEVRNETSCGVVGPEKAQHHYRKNLPRHVIKSVPSVILFGMRALRGGPINTH